MHRWGEKDKTGQKRYEQYENGYPKGWELKRSFL
jgi:hypothetical protein